MVYLTSTLFLAAATALVSAQTGGSNNFTSDSFKPFTGNPFQKYDLTANGINASFIPYGARLTNLYVKDRNSTWQDVVLGFDNPMQHLTDTETNHTYFGPVVGRYTNRIKNGTFTIDGVTSHIPENENGGIDTLHGGLIGYDQQNWTVASVTGNSISFVFYDQAQQGFPGDILNVATYTLTDDASFIIRLVSIPFNDATPIMLANHIYWNLGAFVSQEATTVLNHTVYMPYADRVIDVDGILVPTGGISVTNGTGYDFTQPGGKQIGRDLFALQDGCGADCVGYDKAFIFDRPRYQPNDPELLVLQLTSPETGIQMNLQTNQQGIQFYACNRQNGTIPLKASQQHQPGNTSYIPKYGCLVLEAQDWMDGINQPQWGRQEYQIYRPTSQPYYSYQKYSFTVVN